MAENPASPLPPKSPKVMLVAVAVGLAAIALVAIVAARTMTAADAPNTRNRVLERIAISPVSTESVGLLGQQYRYRSVRRRNTGRERHEAGSLVFMRRPARRYDHRHAGVAQLAERQPSKLHVASSNLVSRSTPITPRVDRQGR